MTFQIHSDDRRFGHKHLTVLRQPHVHQQLVYSSHPSNRFFFSSLAAWAGCFTGLSSQRLKRPRCVIIRPANRRHRAPFPNILIQFGRASEGSFSKPRSPPIHHFCVHLHFIYWCQRFTHVANHNAWGQWCHQMLLIYKREQVLGNAGKTRWQLFMTMILWLLSFQHKLLWALHSTTSQPPPWILITTADSSICENYRKHKHVTSE